MPSMLGKRFRCTQCECEILVTKAGTGTLVCHGSPMTLMETRKLPSSD
jgi:desulfoferrodoxin